MVQNLAMQWEALGDSPSQSRRALAPIEASRTRDSRVVHAKPRHGDMCAVGDAGSG